MCVYKDTDIAVIGMAGRFPGAADINEYWNNMKHGIESIKFFSEDELLQSGVAHNLLQNKNYVKAKGFLEDTDNFDSQFFRYTIKEANLLHPQTRLFHESVYAALEDAGYSKVNPKNKIGLFAGATCDETWRNLLDDQQNDSTKFNRELLVNKDFMCSNVAYRLGLKGPCYSINTACSTSLTAIHLACQSILSDESEMAIAGGASITFPSKSGYIYEEGLVNSPDGHCCAFDKNAKGTITGNGVGAVVLKKLSKAVADKDAIYAIIKGTAVNNDGNNKLSFAAPGFVGVESVIKEAYEKAAIDPEKIKYIEMHGTGTPLGDEVELAALKSAFREKQAGGNKYVIGSVKANIGHLDAAAGIASLIKTVLVLYYKQIPPTVNFRTPNDELVFDNEMLSINTTLIDLDDKNSICAGVNSLGQGGTNVHVVLESFPKNGDDDIHTSNEEQVMLFSAKTETALRNYIDTFCEYVNSHEDINLADAAYTLAVTKYHYPFRAYLTAKRNYELKEKHYIVNKVESLPSYESSSAKFENNEDIRYTPKEIGELWTNGSYLNLEKVFAHKHHKKVHLPSYAFEKTKHPVISLKEESKDKNVSQKQLKTFYYKFDWKLDPLSCSLPANHTDGCLIFTDSLHADQVNQYFSSRGDRVVVAQAGETFSKINDNYFVFNTEEQSHYDYIFRYMKNRSDDIKYIINLLPLSLVIEFNELKSNRMLNLNLLRLRYMILGISKYFNDKNITIGNVTDNFYRLQRPEKANFSFVGLSGIQEVIAKEYLNITCVNIDFNDMSQPKEDMFSCILSELYNQHPVNTAVYDRGYRFVPEFNEITEEDSELRIVNNGVYIILGGSGRIGKLIADFISQTADCTIVLTGLNQINEVNLFDIREDSSVNKVEADLYHALRRIAKRGSKILLSKVDILDEDGVSKFFTRVSRQCGKINGIINCIGVTDKQYNQIIEDTKTEDVLHQLRIREDGLTTLDFVIDKYDYDFCILFSSIASVLGGLGQFGYAGACSFMDQYIRTRNKVKKIKWEVINMDTWMTANGYEEAFHLIPYNIAFVMLNRIFQHNSVHEYMITFTDIQNYFMQNKLIMKRYETKVTDQASGDINEIISAIWEDIFGRVITETEKFVDIGGDSLKALEIISRIYNKLGIRIKIKDLLGCQTMNKLIAFIKESSSSNEMTAVFHPDQQQEERFQCSFAQREMFLSKNNIYPIRFNLTCIFVVTGDINLDNLTLALNQLIKRHEIYRTCFIHDNGEYYQKIEENLTCEIKHANTNDIDAAIEKFIVGFDISKLPLLRMQLVTDNESGKQFLVTDMHHAIFDDQSIQLFFDELLSLYAGNALEHKVRQFKEYSARQHQDYSRGYYQFYREFWKNKQKEYQYTELITDKSAVTNTYKKVSNCLIDETQYMILSQLANRMEMSLSPLILSIWMLIISHFASQDHVAAGIRITNRLSEFKNTMGCFLEKVILTATINRQDSLENYIESFKQGYYKTIENSFYPFYLLTQDYQQDKYFSILFNYMKVEDHTISNGDITLTPYKYQPKTLNSKYHFNFRFMDNNKKIVCSLKYKNSVYSDTYIETMFALFQEIVDNISTYMATPITKLLLKYTNLP